MSFSRLVCGAMVVLLSACSSTPATLPQGVTLRPGKASGGYIDTRELRVRPAPFKRVEFCLAQEVSNPGVTLTGGTAAPFVLDRYPRTSTVNVGGGNIFKYQDANAGVAIVTGTTDAGPSLLGTTRLIVRFDLSASAPEGSADTLLTFRNIARADQDTGAITNDGFTPVGSWEAAQPEAVVAALDGIASAIDSCLK